MNNAKEYIDEDFLDNIMKALLSDDEGNSKVSKAILENILKDKKDSISFYTILENMEENKLLRTLHSLYQGYDAGLAYKLNKSLLNRNEKI